jgi:hypothetical protein
MPGLRFPTPALGQWLSDLSPAAKSNHSIRLGALEGWARQAESELQLLRRWLADAERKRDEYAQELAFAETAVEDARAEARRVTDEDAETTRPIRGTVFADGWDALDGIASAFIPEPGFSHVLD